MIYSDLTDRLDGSKSVDALTDNVSTVFGIGTDLADGSDVFVRNNSGMIEFVRVGYNPIRTIFSQEIQGGHSVDSNALLNSDGGVFVFKLWRIDDKVITLVQNKEPISSVSVYIAQVQSPPIQVDELGLTILDNVQIDLSTLGLDSETSRLSDAGLEIAPDGKIELVFSANNSADFKLDLNSGDADNIGVYLTDEVQAIFIDNNVEVEPEAPDEVDPEAPDEDVSSDGLDESLTSSSTVEKTVLGSESDIFYGSANDDDVQTGGGDDRIYTGAGDDVIVVQGEKISATPHAAHSSQTFNVRVQDGVYYLDGIQQKNLNFVSGETYRFDVSDQSNSMHPMQFSTNYDGHHGHGGYNEYFGAEGFGWDSISEAGTPGAYVEFTVPSDFSDYASEVFYYCNNHPGMGGTAAVEQAGAAITEGSDTVVDAGSGADVVVVEGQGDASVDVGADTDADTVRVDSSFAGTLLIKNADTSDTVEIMRDTGAWSVDEEGTIVIEMGGQDTITIENYLSYDEVQDMYVSTGPVITATGYTPFDLGFGDLSLVSVRGSNYTDDLLYSPSYNAAAEEGVFYNASGWDGDDVIYGGGGTQQLLGGEGTDTFHLSSNAQSTLIVGDRDQGRTQAANDGD
ncbi:hypothetical protein N9847_01720, partial [bacterium]|nr:hypothetical protein [bacterium]